MPANSRWDLIRRLRVNVIPRLLCWYLQNFVFWIPWRCRPRAETCRKFYMLCLISSRFVCICWLLRFFFYHGATALVEDSWSHAVKHITFHRTPLDEGSAHRRDLYLTTHNIQKRQTNIHAPGGIRTHNPSKRAAADSHLGPRGRCHRRLLWLIVIIMHGMYL